MSALFCEDNVRFVLRTLLRLGAPPRDAEDLAQEVFVIAHRLTTVRHADRIVVLEHGRITDSGSHDDLLARLGTYRKLYELQFMDLEPKMSEEPAVAFREPRIGN